MNQQLVVDYGVVPDVSKLDIPGVQVHQDFCSVFKGKRRVIPVDDLTLQPIQNQGSMNSHWRNACVYPGPGVVFDLRMAVALVDALNEGSITAPTGFDETVCLAFGTILKIGPSYAVATVYKNGVWRLGHQAMHEQVTEKLRWCYCRSMPPEKLE